MHKVNTPREGEVSAPATQGLTGALHSDQRARTGGIKGVSAPCKVKALSYARCAQVRHEADGGVRAVTHEFLLKSGPQQLPLSLCEVAHLCEREVELLKSPHSQVEVAHRGANVASPP